MKTFSAEAIAALQAGAVVTAAAVKIETSPDPFLAWTGEGVLTIAGEAYIGVGANGLVTATGSQVGGTADKLELILSAVDPSTIDVTTVLDARDRRVTVYRLMFDSSGQVLLDAQVFERGRIDKLQWVETPGGTSQIKALVETAAKGLGRRTGRLTADADQRMIDPDDNSLSRVTHAGELTLAWGGKPPSRAGLGLPTAVILAGVLDKVFGR
jgi:hypothetical protein